MPVKLFAFVISFCIFTQLVAAAESLPISNSIRVFSDCKDCPEMVVIPAGSFEMGASETEKEDAFFAGPVHKVTFAKPFAMGKTEVTQSQWKSIMGTNPSHFQGCGDNCPVEQVSWDEAKQFIDKYSTKTGKQYRLPSEAEWEYACRSGRQHKYCGSDDADKVAWYWGNSQGFFSGGRTHKVGLKNANDWGLFDMSGNVAEWVDDCIHYFDVNGTQINRLDNVPELSNTPLAQKNIEATMYSKAYIGAPTDGSSWKCDMYNTQHIFRGGAWVNEAGGGLSAPTRYFEFASVPRIMTLGFRLALSLQEDRNDSPK